MSSRFRILARRLVHNDLPLGAPRLFFMLMSFVFSIVAGGLCLKIWTKHHNTQKELNASLPPGISAMLEYEDVRTTSILLFLANHLVTFTTSHIAIAILHDLFGILPPFVLRRIKLPAGAPLSSATLPHQAVALLGATACYVLASAFHTSFVFTRTGTLRVDGDPGAAAAVDAALARLGIALQYRRVPYILVSAELPWPTVFFALGACATTLAAWYQHRQGGAVPGEGSEEIVTVDQESKGEGKETEFVLAQAV